MIKINKNPTPPTLFAQWCKRYQTDINAWCEDSQKTGGDLWNQLGQTFGHQVNNPESSDDIRADLQKALGAEQHGFCCYCGIKLEDNEQSIEHFLPKGKNKHLTFEYTNLMLCCAPHTETKYVVGGKYKHRKIEEKTAWSDVAAITNIDVASIKHDKRNKLLVNKPSLQNGDKIFVPNPPHCDSNKSKYDSNPQPTTIIDPTRDSNAIDLLKFDNNGEIKYPEGATLQADTIKVLNLNCDKLKRLRKEAWENAESAYEALFDENRTSKADLQNLINNLKKFHAPSNSNVSFPFVYIAYYNNLLGI